MRRSLAVCVDAFHHTHRTFWNGRTRRSESVTFYMSCIPELCSIVHSCDIAYYFIEIRCTSVFLEIATITRKFSEKTVKICPYATCTVHTLVLPTASLLFFSGIDLP